MMDLQVTEVPKLGLSAPKFELREYFNPVHTHVVPLSHYVVVEFSQNAYQPIAVILIVYLVSGGGGGA